MSHSKQFVSTVLTAVFATAWLASGTAAAQDAVADKASQAAPQASREVGSGMASGKRQHKPVTMSIEMNQQAAPHTMADMDTDKDGRLSRSEFAAAHGGRTDEFAAHDGNGDGFITQAEMHAHHAATETKH